MGRRLCKRCKKKVPKGEGWISFTDKGTYYYHADCFEQLHKLELESINNETKQDD